MNFQGSGVRIQSVDFPRVGHEIGVGEDEIRAVVAVEAAGSGFDKQGRIKILFEPHVFWRCLPSALRPMAEQLGLAYPKWKRDYPADSYPRLIQAMKIHETAALKACSWGLGQILGENHIAAGYSSPQAMVQDFTRDEDNHLEAMIRFIKHNKLDDEIRAHNWAGFARGYNGPGYAANNYHINLANAYQKWRGIPDVDWRPGQEIPPKPPTPPKPVETVKVPASPPPPAKTGAGTATSVIVTTGAAGGVAAGTKAAINAGASHLQIGLMIGFAVIVVVAIIVFIKRRK